VFFFFFLSLYAFPPKGALGYEAVLCMFLLLQEVILQRGMSCDAMGESDIYSVVSLRIRSFVLSPSEYISYPLRIQ